MARDLVIGLDCGTSACKAVVWDGSGRALAEGRAPLDVLEPRPLWKEQDAEDWWAQAARALRQATRGVDPKRIAALCIAHQRESFVPVDADGNPLRKALLWMDERAGPLLGELEARFGAERFRSITGKALSGNLSIAKLYWLSKHEPELFSSAKYFLDTHAFLAHRLTGLFRTSWGSADPTGLFDMAAKAWSGELLAGIGLGADRLPEALAPGEILGPLEPRAAKACGLPPGIPLVSGLGDGQAAGLGCGIAGEGESYLSLGTSIVSGTYSKAFVAAPAFRSSFGSPDSYFLETVILGGTYTLRWYVDRFLGGTGRRGPGAAARGRRLEARLGAEAEGIPPGSGGLLLVPYWSSAMNPYWDSAARGIVVGWDGSQGQAHFYRAILEGMAFEQRLHTAGVEEALGKPIERYVALGGGSKSGLWCGIIADVTGKELRRSASAEASALGAGILGAVAAGLHPDLASASRAMTRREAEPFLPDPARRDFYRRLYEGAYASLYPRLKDNLAGLAELGGEMEIRAKRKRG